MGTEGDDALSDLVIDYITHVLGYPSDAEHPDEMGDPIGDHLQGLITEAIKRSKPFAQQVHLALGEGGPVEAVAEYNKMLDRIHEALKIYNVPSTVEILAIGEKGVMVQHPIHKTTSLLIDAGDAPWGFAVVEGDNFDMKAAGVFLTDAGVTEMGYDVTKSYVADIERLAVIAAVAWHVSASPDTFAKFIEVDHRFRFSVVLDAA